MRRILCFVMALVMIFGVIPAQAFAEETAPETQVDTGDVTIAGTNGFGNLLSEAISEEQAETESAYDAGYTVTDLEIEGNVATVTYDSMEEAILVVALYSEDGMQLLTYAKAAVTADPEDFVDHGIAVASGECGAEGDNVTWTLYSSGVLQLSGTGPMADYEAYGASPWWDLRESITSVDMKEGITTIGSRAFGACTNLASMTIPESVTTIGNTAFGACASLASLIIPDGVTTIGGGAFAGCTSLTEVIIPNSVTTIGERAFSSCSSLTEVIIPDSVTTIGDDAFRCCYSLTEVIIPDSVTTIGDYAFQYCYNLTDVIVPNGIMTISEGAFSDCYSLTEVIIPDSVTTIGDYAFLYCTSLTEVIIPDSVTTIGDYAFLGCTSLTEMIIPDSVTTIGDYAFSDCTSLNDVTIPGSVTYINNGSFQACSSLVHVAIPEGVTQIGEYAFAYCASLNRIILPDSLTHIGSTAFRNCDSLTRITIPDGVTYLGDWAFCDCESLKSITIPETITRIRSYTFYRCNSLNDVYYGGSKEKWDAVVISIHNESLNSATIHYNSTDPEEAPAYRLEVYTQDNTFSVQEDDATHFDVYLLENGSELYDWNCPAVTIADESVCTYTIEQIDSKYRVNITGKSIGQTLITITDSATGATIDVPMTVVYNLDGVNSYLLDDIPKFYPNSNIDGHLLTNFYNHRGLYINNFKSYYVEKTDSYHISMNAYNSNYYHGAIDVYDANGELYRCYQIEKFSDVSSFKDMGEYLIHFMDNAENPLAYDSGTIGKETKLEFDVPAGGFFTISNNVRTSMGTFLYNMCDMMLFGLTMTLDIADTHTNMGKNLKEEIFERVATDKAFQGAILDLMWELTGNMMGDYVKKAEAVNSMEDTLDAFYDILKSYMSIETVLAGILGIEEAVLTNLGGPAAWGVKTIFTASKYNSYILQTSCMIFAPNTAPIVISCRTSGRSDSLFGVKVIGNLPENSILQVNPVVGSGLDDIIDAYMELETNRSVSRYDCTAFSVQVIADNRIHILEAPVQVVIPSDEDAERIVGVLHKQGDGAWKRIDYQIVDGEVVLTANSMGRFAIIYEAEPSCPHNIKTEVPSQSADCVNSGNNLYFVCDSCGLVFKADGITETTVEAETIPALGHDYDEVITEPTCQEQGYTTYTCTNCGDSYVDDYTDPVEHVYEGGKCKWCGEEQTNYVKWYSGATSLNGTIDLLMFVILSEDLVNDPDTFVRFTFENRVVDVPMAEAVESTLEDGTVRYRFSCPLYAKQLADAVVVQVMRGDTPVGKSVEYSAMKYCYNIIKKNEDPKQVAICKAMLNYGAAAQLFFDYNTENLANENLPEEDKNLPDLDLSAYKYDISGSEPGIKARSAALTLESEIRIRVFFTLEDGRSIDDYTFTVDGVEVKPSHNATGWYIESAGIPAKEMEQMHDFCVGGITVRYCALSHANSKLTAEDPLEVNLAKALYAYYAAAEALLG